MSQTSPTQAGSAPRLATGLLEQIVDTALDDDYYVFRGSEPRPGRTARLVVGLIVTVFAVFVTTAAVQTRNDRPSTELERRTLAADIEARQKILDERRATAAGLSAEVQSLRRSDNGSVGNAAGLRVLAAADAAEGPGIIIRAQNSSDGNNAGRITDRDLQVLVNGLWYAGAEAVAIDDNRVGALTSIRTAGDAITVNYRSISAPYTVVALGASDILRTRFAQIPAGAYWDERHKSAGVKYTVTPSSDVTVPATPSSRLQLNHATSLKEGR
jgi:uncharacterized protein YlxW (UPF0749 family)